MSERRERWRTWIDNQVRKDVLTMFLQRDAYTVSASRALALVALAATALAVSALLGSRLLRTLGTDTIPAAVSPTSTAARPGSRARPALVVVPTPAADTASASARQENCSTMKASANASYQGAPAR